MGQLFHVELAEGVLDKFSDGVDGVESVSGVSVPVLQSEFEFCKEIVNLCFQYGAPFKCNLFSNMLCYHASMIKKLNTNLKGY